ncbi:MAG: plasmid pRiA4b ORF-3 family protein [Bacteroidota bacterium]|nr:plasmid pRiA4b ORF-3 family protein [Bacteroidota bacterium]
MAVLKFRAYYEDDESVYRDIVVKHTQTFADLHNAILKAYEFDNKHQATFYRSNDSWQRGREITLQKYDKEYKAAPLIMADTTIGSEIKDPNQKFIYTYDFVKGWAFLVELINVTKEESPKTTYPSTARTEGIGPAQYGTKSLLGDKFVDIEEKYDLSAGAEGFGREGVSDAVADTEDSEEESFNDETDSAAHEEEF